MSCQGANTTEVAALVALLRSSRLDWREYAERLEEAGSARALLDQEQGLLAGELIDSASETMLRWRRAGMQLLTVLDTDYPENLRGIHDHPPLIFVRGQLAPTDARAVAVIGARDATPAGIGAAEQIATGLADCGFTVLSGLARGIDTAAHTTVLARGGRTLAVIGTGLLHAYPPENAPLQEQIAAEGAVISQFWPDTPPARGNFPMRNAVMSGMALATMIVEAGPTSGARTQARLALAHGRPVLLMEALLEQHWARELSRRPSVHVVGDPADVPSVVAQVSSAELPAV